MRCLLSAGLLGWVGIHLAVPAASAQPISLKSTGVPANEGAKETNSVVAVGPSADVLTAKLEQARTDLARVAENASRTNWPEGISPSDLAMRRAWLQRLVWLYEKQLGDAQEVEAVRQRKAQLRRQAQDWTGFSEPRPYSILLADGLREDLRAVTMRTATAETALTVLSQSSEVMKQTLAQAEEEIRRLNEQLEGEKNSAAADSLTWKREQRRFQSRVAAASLAALETERQINQERLAENRLRLGLLQRQFVIAQAGVEFTQADLDKVLAGVEQDRLDCERELAAAAADRHSRIEALEEAREQLRQARGTSAEADRTHVAELVELRQAQAETVAVAIEVLRLMVEGANVGRTMWELRYAAYRSHSVAKLQDSERQLEEFARRIQLWKEYYAQRLVTASGEVEAEQGRLLHLGPDSQLAGLAREHLESFRQREQLLLRACRAFERIERLGERFNENLQESKHGLPWLSRVRSLFATAGSFSKKLWTFELLTAEDTIVVDGQPITGRRSITLGKVVKVVIIMTVGFWITGFVSKMIQGLAEKRLGIEANQASLIRRWVRAGLIFGLILVSLMWVKIPFTVFAFAGGALAIGVGFGTQTLLKNFISGIIILFERPFRVGDVLDVEGNRGRVTSIGIRSSVLQLWDGTEVLIPNSELLERKVTNWTFSNRLVRFTIEVGVAYGTDTRRVIAILIEVAERHGLVAKEPKPQAFLTRFDDSALAFELRFWVDILINNPAQISSDLRQMITGAFAENGIVIAFPQRDLHFQAAPFPLMAQSERP